MGGQVEYGSGEQFDALRRLVREFALRSRRIQEWHEFGLVLRQLEKDAWVVESFLSIASEMSDAYVRVVGEQLDYFRETGLPKLRQFSSHAIHLRELKIGVAPGESLDAWVKRVSRIAAKAARSLDQGNWGDLKIAVRELREKLLDQRTEQEHRLRQEILALPIAEAAPFENPEEDR